MRGPGTFQRIADYRGAEVAELAVDYCVPEIERHVLSVDIWHGKTWERNIWYG